METDQGVARRRDERRQAGIASAISGLEPGDLLLCQVDQVDVALDFVRSLFRQAEARPIVPIAQFAAAALAALGIVG